MARHSFICTAGNDPIDTYWMVDEEGRLSMVFKRGGSYSLRPEDADLPEAVVWLWHKNEIVGAVEVEGQRTSESRP
jgi:hypothetical protein